MKKIIRVFLVLILLMLSSCNAPTSSLHPQEPPEVNLNLKEYTQDHFFPISSFWCPNPNESDYLRYQEAGFNTVMMVNHGNSLFSSETQYFLGSALTLQALQLCKKLGLKAIPQYGDWLKAKALGVYPKDGISYNSVVDMYENFDYTDYEDTIISVHMYDEPNVAKIDYLQSLVSEFESIFPNAAFFNNLYPNYASSEQTGQSTYSEYVDYYCRNILNSLSGRKILSADFYPLQFSKGDKECYLDKEWTVCYETIANAAKQYGAETHFYIQSVLGDSLSKKKQITEGDIRIQVNMALAFGARALSYFCYETPDSFDSAIIDKNGNPTELYQHASKVNAEISTLTNIMMNFNWQSSAGIYGSEENSSYFYGFDQMDHKLNPEEYQSVRTISSTHNAIISYFIDQDKNEGFFIMNYCDVSTAKTATVQIDFDKMNYVAIIDGSQSKAPIMKNLPNSKLTLTLEPGQGLFFIPYFEAV